MDYQLHCRIVIEATQLISYRRKWGLGQVLFAIQGGLSRVRGPFESRYHISILDRCCQWHIGLIGPMAQWKKQQHKLSSLGNQVHPLISMHKPIRVTPQNVGNLAFCGKTSKIEQDSTKWDSIVWRASRKNWELSGVIGESGKIGNYRDSNFSR
jgi:hypothetical protein